MRGCFRGLKDANECVNTVCNKDRQLVLLKPEVLPVPQGRFVKSKTVSVMLTALQPHLSAARRGGSAIGYFPPIKPITS